ncbi:thioredoxin family protein [Chloroflexota bacterium]
MKVLGKTILLLLVMAVLWSALGCQSGSEPQVATGKPSLELKADILGKTHNILLDDAGRLVTTSLLASPDGDVILSIDKGTRLIDEDKKPLSYISVKTTQDVICIIENAYVFSTVYSLEPQDAVFSPSLKLTIRYNPDELPKGVRENDIYIAPYDEDKGWGYYSNKSNNVAENTVSTRIDHFAVYGSVAPLTPSTSQPPPKPSSAATPGAAPLVSMNQALSNGLPTIAELGSSTCIPCKQMKPILEELARDYQGKINVVIIDVYQERELSRQYSIRLIPTQIIFDSKGKEVTRHTGVWPRADIIAQFNKFGVE